LGRERHAAYQRLPASGWGLSGTARRAAPAAVHALLSTAAHTVAAGRHGTGKKVAADTPRQIPRCAAGARVSGVARPALTVPGDGAETDTTPTTGLQCTHMHTHTHTHTHKPCHDERMPRRKHGSGVGRVLQGLKCAEYATSLCPTQALLSFLSATLSPSPLIHQ
jgi:hypothetical protein